MYFKNFKLFYIYSSIFCKLMGVGVCVSTPNDTNKVIKVNQLEDKDNVIDNFNYEEYAVDKDLVDKNKNENNSINNISFNDKHSDNVSQKQNVVNVFEKGQNNNNEEENKHIKFEETKNEEEKKEIEKIDMENITKEEQINESNKNETTENNNNQIEEIKEINVDNNLNNNNEVPKLKSILKNNQNNNEINKNGNNDINIEKNNENNNIKKEVIKIKLPDLNSILTEKLLLETNNDEPIFVSELLKMSNFNIKEKTKYYDRFCVMSKITFFIYHSKENYILLKKPLAEIPIKNIKTIVLFKINKKLVGYDHFYINIEKNNELKETLDQLDLFYFNDKMDNNNDNIEDEDLLLIFKSSDKTLIKKWYVLLNYFKKFNA